MRLEVQLPLQELEALRRSVHKTRKKLQRIEKENIKGMQQIQQVKATQEDLTAERVCP